MRHLILRIAGITLIVGVLVAVIYGQLSTAIVLLATAILLVMAR